MDLIFFVNVGPKLAKDIVKTKRLFFYTMNNVWK